ncbi:MAG: hypothetical protein JRI44_00250 [Deltaproteobacteria bacterium]|nr:hypothetical protein [Deltaproteobacteria bacterium]
MESERQNQRDNDETRIELYLKGDYSDHILTYQENYVIQGMERISPVIELWYGKNQDLPFCPQIMIYANAGNELFLGKEIVENGWLKLSLDDAPFIPLSIGNRIGLGYFFSNTKKDLRFKLDIPEGADTKGYFVIELIISARTPFIYGTTLYGKRIFSYATLNKAIHEQKLIYRAFVFDNSMIDELLTAGASFSE